MARLFALIILSCVLFWSFTAATSTVSSFLTDPFGATTRTAIQSRTALETKRLETRAAVEIASLQAQAQIESARTAADAVKVQAQEERKINQVWARVMPLLLLISVGGGALWLVIIYGGRVMCILAENGINCTFRLPRGSNQASHQSVSEPKRRWHPGNDPEAELARYAARHNQRIVRKNGCYMLVDNDTKQVVKQLVLKG